MKNKGFTLVELVVVMAIMGLLGLAVVNFIGTSSNQYKSATKEVDLQYEAQLTMNQIGDLLIDAQKGVKYESGSSANPVEVASVNEENSITSQAASSDSKLIIYDSDCNYNIIYRPADSKIYLRKDTVDESTGNVVEGQESLMAEHVVGFTPDLSEAESKNSINIVVDFKNGDKTYTSTQNFTMRNKVPVGKDVEYVPEPDDPLRVRIYHDGTDVTGGSVTHELKQGTNTLYFTSKVLGGDAPSQDVTWSVSGYTSCANINPTGTGMAKLDFGENETSKQIKVTVTSKEDPTKSASTTIYIKSSIQMLERANEHINAGSTIHVWISNNPTDYDLSDFTWHIKVEQILDDGSKIGRNDLLLYSDTEIVSGGNIDSVNYHYPVSTWKPNSPIESTHISLGNNLMPDNGYKLEISIWLEVKDDPKFKSNTVVLKNYYF